MPKAILLGGPDHGKVVDNVTKFPVLTPKRDIYDNTPNSTVGTNAYFERRVIICDRETKLGVHSALTDGSEYAALLFTTLVKEFYHDIFWRR